MEAIRIIETTYVGEYGELQNDDQTNSPEFNFKITTNFDKLSSEVSKLVAWLNKKGEKAELKVVDNSWAFAYIAIVTGNPRTELIFRRNHPEEPGKENPHDRRITLVSIGKKTTTPLNYEEGWYDTGRGTQEHLEKYNVSKLTYDTILKKIKEIQSTPLKLKKFLDPEKLVNIWFLYVSTFKGGADWGDALFVNAKSKEEAEKIGKSHAIENMKGELDSISIENCSEDQTSAEYFEDEMKGKNKKSAQALLMGKLRYYLGWQDSGTSLLGDEDEDDDF